MSQYSVFPLLCLLASPLWAEPIPEWVGSYSTEGQCYCAPGMSTSLQNKMMPTPIGGQSIGQICERIGSGPALELSDSGFNYPAYHDAQCGNGPTTLDSDGCDGRLADNDSICAGIGPVWDLKAIYSKPTPAKNIAKAVPAETESAQASADAQAASDKKALEVAEAKLAAAIAKAKADNEAAAQREAAKIAASRIATKTVEVPETTEGPEATDIVSEATKNLPEKTDIVSESQTAQLDAADKIEAAKGAQSSTDEVRAAEIKAAQIRVAESRAAEAQAVEARAAEARVAEIEAAEARVAEIEAAEARAAEIEAAEARAAEARTNAAKLEAEEELANSELANAPAQMPEATIAEPKLEADVATSDAAKQEVTDSVADSSAAQTTETPVPSAVRLPREMTAIDPSSAYIQIAPISYDFGGVGPSLEGVLGFASSWQFKGRAAVVEEYSELMVGIGRVFRPSVLKGGIVSLLAGWEYGNFDLGITELTDSGAVLDSSLGFVLTPRVSLATGVSYSSFFEGDPSVYGQLVFRIVNNLDLSTRIEAGDNDNFALGLRYNY